MKIRLSILLLISLFLSGCGATAAPTVTLVESTPTALAPQEPTSTVPIVTPTLDIGTSMVTEQTVTAESTMTPQATAAIPQVQMQVLPLPQPGACQQPQNWVAYTVARNDTLSSLGQRTRTSWQQIQSANCLKSTMIFAGQTLYLPFVPPPVVDNTPASILLTPPPPIISPTSLPPGLKKPTVTVTPQLGPAGDTFKFLIEQFPPNEEIIVIIQKVNSDDAPVTLGITADGNGNATMSYISPQNALAGIYNVTVINTPKQKQADEEFTILATPTSAP